VVAFLIWHPPLSLGVVKVFVLSSVFAVLFAGSAYLFHRADIDAKKLRADL